jgi:hypothetical protein
LIDDFAEQDVLFDLKKREEFSETVLELRALTKYFGLEFLSKYALDPANVHVLVVEFKWYLVIESRALHYSYFNDLATMFFTL